jgi:hypothetical protein
MNRTPDVEFVLRDFFAEDGVLASSRTLDVVEDRIMRQPQRRNWRVTLWDSNPNTTLKPVLAIAAIIVVAVAGFALLRPSGPAVVGPHVSTESPGPSPSPLLSPSPTSAPSSSGGVTGACDLMTADEAADALDISSSVTKEPLRHLDKQSVAPPTARAFFCNYRSSARSLFVLRYEPGTGADAFAIWEKAPGVEAVSGLGDDAAWAPAKTTLYLLKGDLLVTILPLEGPDPTLTLEAAKAIGAIVAARM